MAQDLLTLTNSLPFAEDLYTAFLANPSSVDPTWRALFEQVTAAPATPVAGHAEAPADAPAVSAAAAMRMARVFQIVAAYRTRGNLEAHLDPLSGDPPPTHTDLDPATFGFSQADLDVEVSNGGMYGLERASLREILRRLRATYTRSIGVEYMHITWPEKRRWLQERMESSLNETPLDRASQLWILDRLIAAEVFEKFIHMKYVGTKRFGLDGAETAIPLLDLVLERAGDQGVDEAVIGMAHRGRLNVLANIMDKQPNQIFAEFEDWDPESVLGGGDVKYHLGFSSDHTTRGGKTLHLSLSFNPSHLEAVDPVVVGRVRAKQRRRRDTKHERVLGVLLHGDAAFAGQGLVAEVLNLSDLTGFRTGGTVHIIINNQIGFTTSPTSARSTPYCTDVAKMVQVPIFHVNGEDPEAVAHVVALAMDYRKQFRTDVVIDMYCFRRWGHNEADEPSFTQPLMYKKINAHPSATEVYAQRLIERGVLTQDEFERRIAAQHKELEEEHERARQSQKRPQIESMQGSWVGYTGGADLDTPDLDTGVQRERLQAISAHLSKVPADFHPHPKIQRLLAQRGEMGQGKRPIDWAMAEALAFGSLLWGGTLVRMSGQDCRRGTFSQRHAVLIDCENGAEYAALATLHDKQGEFRLYDSTLSEAGVLGFEFGYSLDYPDGLVMWEAQFGDFVNGAQVIIDQFLASSEDKWGRLSGLTMLLPHAFEGQGPEHSSARLERFLQLCAEDNIQVAYPTTPAQYYHLLRRQVLRRFRKPLVVMTPKSLLRLPACTSQLGELEAGRFQRVIDDAAADVAKVDRVLLCSGKLYFELAEERARLKDDKVAILRLEQLYPLREAELTRVLARYQPKQFVWVQEEPENMGARQFLSTRLPALVGERPLSWIHRPMSGSPATGSHKAHVIEQRRILDAAFKR